MVNNRVFSWPKPLFFMVLGLMVYIYLGVGFNPFGKVLISQIGSFPQGPG